MAKKQSGPGTGMILTLVFFVLTTFIAGTIAYFGYADQEDLKKQADTAKKAEQAAIGAKEDLEAQLYILRIANEIDDPDDRQNLKFLVATGKRGAKAREEYTRVVSRLPVGARTDFGWNLKDDEPDAAPTKTIPQIVKDYEQAKKDAIQAKETAEAGKLKADQAAAADQKKLESEKAAFAKSIGDLQAQVNTILKQKKDDLDTFTRNLAKAGEDIQKEIRDRQALEDKLLKEIEFLNKKNKELSDLVAKFQDKRDIGPDLVALDQKKGTVDRRDGTFVYIDLGQAHYLRPQTKFTILPSDGTWRNSEERERQIKGQIEVVEILGPYSSRCKVLDEVSPIRNPIRSKDMLFNLVWTPGGREHVAFAGIIDMNGDGIDDNLDFIRFLEKQGVIIDAHLDLRDRQIKGKGQTLQTKFLVMGPQVEITEDEARRSDKDPRVAAKQDIMVKMGTMREEAKKLGIQLIDHRKFLAMIGYKLPERPAPAEYGASVYVNRNVPAPKDSEDTPAPEPKKAEPRGEVAAPAEFVGEWEGKDINIKIEANGNCVVSSTFAIGGGLANFELTRASLDKEGAEFTIVFQKIKWTLRADKDALTIEAGANAQVDPKKATLKKKGL